MAKDVDRQLSPLLLSALEIIHHAVWLYFRFPLSYRHVEDLLTERIDFSYETVRRWALKSGRLHAQQLRRLRPNARLQGACSAQRTIHSAIYNTFNIQRH